jgi:hypothetical protein
VSCGVTFSACWTAGKSFSRANTSNCSCDLRSADVSRAWYMDLWFDLRE